MQNINREHPEYVARKAMWKQYKDLYAGGEQLRLNACDYLVRRQKEPAPVYEERLSRVFYENYVGSIVDWYAATLMRREPMLLFEGSDAGAKHFYNLLSDDCDLKGTNLHEFFRQRFVQVMVCGSSFVVVDFPKIGDGAQTRAEEDASGRSRAYLVDYSADEVINWNYDEAGRLDWVVIRTSCLQQSKVTDAKWEKETRWIYYDRENYQIFRKAGESEAVELVDEGRHGLAVAAQGSGIRDESVRGAVADEQGCAAAIGALQQIQRTFVGVDDGTVRESGSLFGQGMEPGDGRELLTSNSAKRTGSGGRSRRERYIR